MQSRLVIFHNIFIRFVDSYEIRAMIEINRLKWFTRKNVDEQNTKIILSFYGYRPCLRSISTLAQQISTLRQMPLLFLGGFF